VAEAIFTMTKGFRYNCACSTTTPKPSIELVAVEIPSGIMRFREGYVVNIFHLPETGIGVDAFIETLSIALRNNMKVLAVSYTHPRATVV
jgi:hypothetical protein